MRNDSIRKSARASDRFGGCAAQLFNIKSDRGTEWKSLIESVAARRTIIRVLRRCIVHILCVYSDNNGYHYNTRRSLSFCFGTVRGFSVCNGFPYCVYPTRFIYYFFFVPPFFRRLGFPKSTGKGASGLSLGFSPPFCFLHPTTITASLTSARESTPRMQYICILPRDVGISRD